MVGFVRSVLRDAQVIGLVLGEGGELDAEMLQMSFCDLLVKLLGQHVDADLVLGVTGPEFDLGEDLIGEGVAHDERGMTHGASEVNKTALGEEDDVFAVLEGVAIDLGLDVALDGVLVQPGGVDLAVEMSNVADDGIFQHLLKMAALNDAGATRGGDEDASFLASLVHGGDLEAFHGGLQGVDGINFCDQDFVMKIIK